MHAKQNGFSLPHILLGLVGVAIIGFTGWRVYEARKDANKSLDNASKSSEVVKQEQKKKEEPKTEYKLPDSYTVYENKALGFSFALPKEWGTLNDASAEAPNNKFYAKTDNLSSKNLPPKGLSGLLVVYGYSLQDSKIYTRKYGPYITPQKTSEGYTFKVVESNPADPHQIGDEYPQKTLVNVQQTKLYDTAYSDEGCYRSVWLFEATDSFVQIIMPSICGPSVGDPADSALRAQYDAISKNIADSIKVDRL